MFGFSWCKAKVLELENKINMMGFAIRELEKKPIGMIYVLFNALELSERPYYPATILTHEQRCRGYRNTWITLNKGDITENHNGDIKVFGWWHSKDNVMFYDVIYNDRKKKIEAKYK